MFILKGLVIKSTGSWYDVKGDDGNHYKCRLKGSMRQKGIGSTNPVAVGDKVEIEQSDEVGIATIASIDDRANYIIRKSVKLSKQSHILAANIDLGLVVATPEFPRTSTGFIDRFLSTAEAYRIPAGVVFNKMDLYDKVMSEYVTGLSELYSEIGYSTFILSALDQGTLGTLRETLKGKTTLMAGHSGTGKSTLINALIPGLDLRTNEISLQHLKGKHTTTFAEMHELPGGGFIIDTPGIREFGILDFDKKEVSHFFPEIFEISGDCKFSDCMHLTESGCAVVEALELGKISPTRYHSYLSILENEDVFR
jgi:ribosome biogenesis GTPase